MAMADRGSVQRRGVNTIMTEDHKFRLRHYRMELVENVYLKPIADILRQENVLSAEQLETIMMREPQATSNDRVRKLLEYMPRKPDGAFYAFVDSLRTHGYEYLSDMLEDRPLDGRPDAGVQYNLGIEMTPEHRDALRDKITNIIENVIVNPIVDELFGWEVLSEEQKNNILLSQPNPNDQVRKLLDILPRKSDQAYYTFVDGLRKYGYDYLADKLDDRQHAPGEFTLTEEHRMKLVSNTTVLIDTLDVRDVLDYLIQENAVSFREYEEIMRSNVTHEQTRRFLTLLMNKPDRCYVSFIESLRRNNYPHLVRRLGEPDRGQTQPGSSVQSTQHGLNVIAAAGERFPVQDTQPPGVHPFQPITTNENRSH